MALSCVDCARWGIKKTSYYEGVKELEAKGYLVCYGGNHYKFHQLPTQVPENGNSVRFSVEDSSVSSRERIQENTESKTAAEPPELMEYDWEE